MRHFATLIFLFFGLTVFISCSKNNSAPSTVAAVNVINANVNSQGIIPNLWASSTNSTYLFSYYNDGDPISFGSVTNYSVVAGKTPTAISLAQAVDTTQTFFNGNFNFKIGGIYSLFVAGSTMTPDTMLVQDVIPHWPYSDSTVGLRFVNLVQEETITVDYISGNGNVVSGLPYKGITGFQSFLASTAEQAQGYNFEIRDAESSTVLTTIQISIVPNLCQTIVFAGSSAAGYTAFTENDY